jgi:hypothetical protein
MDDKEMTFEVEKITPDQAAKYLAHNRRNRRLSPTVVRNYARDMAAGRWRLTSEPIAFNASGDLDNGQHRLEAVRVAGVPVEFAVVRNASPDQFEAIDQGYKRTTAQVLAMDGYENATGVSGAARMVLRYLRYPGIVWAGSGAPISTAEILDYLATYNIATDGYWGVRKLRTLNPSSGLAAEHIVGLQSTSADSWQRFSDGVLNGIGLDAGDPRLALRVYSGEKWGAGQSHLMATILAWNHFLNGKSVNFLRAARGQLPMPRPL